MKGKILKECPWEKNISLFLDDELKKNEKSKFESHLETCETCKSKIEIMKKIDEKYNQLLEKKELKEVICAKNQSILINNSIVIGSDLNAKNDSSINRLVQRAQEMKNKSRKNRQMKIFTFILIFISTTLVFLRADYNTESIKNDLRNNAEVYLCFTKESHRDNLSRDDLNEFIALVRQKLPFNFIHHMESKNETWDTIQYKQHGISYAIVIDIKKDDLGKGSLTLYYQEPKKDMYWNEIVTVNSFTQEKNWIISLSKNLTAKLLSKFYDETIEIPRDEWKEIFDMCWDKENKYFDFTNLTWLQLSHNKQTEYAKVYQQKYAQMIQQPIEKTFEAKGIKFTVALIPPGKFWMGSPENETDRDRNETRHKVLISTPFYISKYEVTQYQWQSIMNGENPSKFAKFGGNKPVEKVSWQQCQSFCDSIGLQLPTEAQWEYSCRGGIQEASYMKDLDSIAWYLQNSNGTTHEVGKKNANAFGLHDMLGNVFEWCKDGHKDYDNLEQIDPMMPYSSGMSMIARGGAWNRDPRDCRAAKRYPSPREGYYEPQIGFRFVIPMH